MALLAGSGCGEESSSPEVWRLIRDCSAPQENEAAYAIVEGRGFDPWIVPDLGCGWKSARADDNFLLTLDGQPLKNTVRESHERLLTQVPSTLASGTYEMELIAPDGQVFQGRVPYVAECENPSTDTQSETLGSDSDSQGTDTHSQNTDDTLDTSPETDTWHQDLVAFFPFSGNPKDHGPYKIELQASPISPSLSENREGAADRSYAFRAEDFQHFVHSEHPSPLGLEQELTVSVWVKLTDPQQDQKILGRTHRNLTVYSGWLLGVAAGKLYPEIWDSQNIRYTMSSGTIEAQEWFHLAITWKSGGKFKGYIDGNLVIDLDASPDPISNTPGSEFKIGVRPHGPSTDPIRFPVDGNIDDIRIYSREFDADEIIGLKGLPPD
jgi:hypothetical protein